MRPTDKIHSSWNPIKKHLYSPKMTELNEDILPSISYKPEKSKIFRAFSMPVDKVKVVILGQDPYPSGRNACGYSFINGSDKVPRSLRVLYNEIITTTEHKNPQSRAWPDQGVLMLNTALTVETAKPNSHKKYWEDFTTGVVKLISQKTPTIWMLWGSNAISYKKHITNSFDATYYDRIRIDGIPISPEYNYILEAPHPMVEYYKGNEHEFYGCNHFYLCNQILSKFESPQINW